MAAYYGTEQYDKAEQCRRTVKNLKSELEHNEYIREKANTGDKYSLYQ